MHTEKGRHSTSKSENKSRKTRNKDSSAELDSALKKTTIHSRHFVTLKNYIFVLSHALSCSRWTLHTTCLWDMFHYLHMSAVLNTS